VAKGSTLIDSDTRAHALVQRAVKDSYDLGAGHGPTNPYAAAFLNDERQLLERLSAAWEILEEANPYALIPEVQSNLAEALEDAGSFHDVAGFSGRIVSANKRIRRADGPSFGATRHMAKILMASARAQSPFRAVMNIRYSEELLGVCKELGLGVEGFSRYEEPPEVKALEGSSLEWGTAKVLREKGYVPDIIFDEGDVGKEPMIRVFGVDSLAVARRVSDIWSLYKEKYL
jgi:predicted fused transcriptional regulator/phosphomethylpyrimidine kinase